MNGSRLYLGSPKTFDSRIRGIFGTISYYSPSFHEISITNYTLNEILTFYVPISRFFEDLKRPLSITRPKSMKFQASILNGIVNRRIFVKARFDENVELCTSHHTRVVITSSRYENYLEGVRNTVIRSRQFTTSGFQDSSRP